MDEDKKGNVQSLERALQLIDILSEKPDGLSLKQLTELSGLNKSTIHRLLKTLSAHGYVYQYSENESYHLGVKILSLGNTLLKNMDVREIARPFLKELSNKTGDVAQLSIECDGKVVYIDKVDNPDKPIRTISQIGRALPVHCSAAGKVIMAWRSQEEIDKKIGFGPYKAYTKNTITDYDVLMEQLAQVRNQGYATDWFEHQDNIYCIGAPIYDSNHEVVAAISLSSTSLDMNPANLEGMYLLVQQTAMKISLGMGYETNKD